VLGLRLFCLHGSLEETFWRLLGKILLSISGIATEKQYKMVILC